MSAGKRSDLTADRRRGKTGLGDYGSRSAVKGEIRQVDLRQNENEREQKKLKKQ